MSANPPKTMKPLFSTPGLFRSICLGFSVVVLFFISVLFTDATVVVVVVGGVTSATV